MIVLWNQKIKISTEIPLTTCGGGCVLTKNRRLIDRADAVIVQMKWMERDKLPPRKSRYVGSICLDKKCKGCE